MARRLKSFVANSRVPVVIQGALHELPVSFEVQQPVAAVVERDHRLLVPLFRFECKVDRAADRVARLRYGDEAFRLRNDLSRLVRAYLIYCPLIVKSVVDPDGT